MTCQRAGAPGTRGAQVEQRAKHHRVRDGDILLPRLGDQDVQRARGQQSGLLHAVRLDSSERSEGPQQRHQRNAGLLGLLDLLDREAEQALRFGVLLLRERQVGQVPKRDRAARIVLGKAPVKRGQQPPCAVVVLELHLKDPARADGLSDQRVHRWQALQGQVLSRMRGLGGLLKVSRFEVRPALIQERVDQSHDLLVDHTLPYPGARAEACTTPAAAGSSASMRHLPLLALLFACSEPVTSPDIGPSPTDLGSADVGPSDAGFADQGPQDQGVPDQGALDAGAEDAGGPAPGFGEISGMCGVLEDELSAPTPSLFVNTIDFGADPYDANDRDRLTAGGQTIVQTGNKNEGSLLSEVFAFEVLQRCEGAQLLKTETQISYTDPMGKKTDLLVQLQGQQIGVSVTRAVGFPRDAPYTEMQAMELLQDKLDDILLSTANVMEADRWQKQILHVIAWGPQHVDSLRAAQAQLSPQTLADTIIVITISDGDDDFLY